MKTFKWTFPDIPLTEREKNPKKKQVDDSGSGGSWILFGVVYLLFGAMKLLGSGSFWTGVSTYFWESAKAEVVASDLRLRTHSGWGEVTYRYGWNGESHEDSDDLFHRWSFGDKEVKYADWSEAYEIGKIVTIFVSGEGETSLGHWPASYTLPNGVTAIVCLPVGLMGLRRGLRQRKMSREEGVESA